MLIQLTTENALQLTVTKSSLGLLKSLLDSYQVPPGKVGGPDGEDRFEEVDTPAPETFDPVYSITNMVSTLTPPGQGTAVVPCIKVA